MSSALLCPKIAIFAGILMMKQSIPRSASIVMIEEYAVGSMLAPG